MAKKIGLKKAHYDMFSDRGSSWMALDLPEVKPPLYAQSFVVFLTFFLVSSVIYSSVTKVSVVIESTGKLATAKPAIPIHAQSNFTVSQIQVKENQIVKAGDILVSSAEGLTPQELNMLKDLQANLQFINSQQPLNQCNKCLKTSEQIVSSIKRLSKNKIAAEILRPLSQTSGVLNQVIAKLEAADLKLEPLKTRLAQLSSAGGRQPASAGAPVMASPAAAQEIKNIESQIEKFHAPFLSVIEKSRGMIINQTAAAAPNLELLTNISGVKSPVEGKIVNIRLKGQGEIIGNHQPVMEIIPADNQILVIIDVSNKDIGGIVVGGPVEVAVDAYPEMDYGVLKGEVSDILPMDGREGSGPYGQDKGFKVRIKLDSQELKVGSATYALLPGMTVRARVVKNKETLLKKFYRSLFHFKEDLRVHNS